MTDACIDLTSPLDGRHANAFASNAAPRTCSAGPSKNANSNLKERPKLRQGAGVREHQLPKLDEGEDLVLPENVLRATSSGAHRLQQLLGESASGLLVALVEEPQLVEQGRRPRPSTRAHGELLQRCVQLELPFYIQRMHCELHLGGHELHQDIPLLGQDAEAVVALDEALAILAHGAKPLVIGLPTKACTTYSLRLRMPTS